jgi:adenylate kinase
MRFLSWIVELARSTADHSFSRLIRIAIRPLGSIVSALFKYQRLGLLREEAMNNNHSVSGNHKALRIVLIGPPGAGKGTQAKLVAEQFAIPHISTGDILRAAVAAESEIGLLVKAVLDAGNLVDDQIIIDLLKERVVAPDCEGGFLLDGCVRTLVQAEQIGGELEGLGLALTHVLDFDVPDQLLLDRIAERGKVSGRSDDSVEVATNRLAVYRELTLPVTEFYRSQKLLTSVDGVGTIDEVFARVVQALA